VRVIKRQLRERAAITVPASSSVLDFQIAEIVCGARRSDLDGLAQERRWRMLLTHPSGYLEWRSELRCWRAPAWRAHSRW
jgi:hypothetical protein